MFEAEPVTLRSIHHVAAGMMAKGSFSKANISLLTGLQLRDLLALEKDADFRSLVDYYKTQKGIPALDPRLKLQVMAITAMDVLIGRMLENGDELSVDELMKVMTFSVEAIGIDGNNSGGVAQPDEISCIKAASRADQEKAGFRPETLNGPEDGSDEPADLTAIVQEAQQAEQV